MEKFRIGDRVVTPTGREAVVVSTIGDRITVRYIEPNEVSLKPELLQKARK